MSLAYRFARSEDVPAVARLIPHSFSHATRTPEWWEEQLQQTAYGDGPEILWVGEDQGRIVAACQLHRLRQWIAGADLPMMGLGTVVMAPTHRKRGLAGELVASGVRAARARGEVASVLYPFRASFYRKQGYGLAGEVLQYLIPPESLPDSELRFRVELVDTAEGRSQVRALYTRWAREQTGQVARTDRVWDELVSAPDRGLAAFRGDNGELQGYALVVYRTDLPVQDRFLDVEELVWTTGDARRGLYAWLSSMGDQWRQILLRALPEHRLGDWLSEPRLPHGAAPAWKLWFPSATLMRGPMFRLLDAAAAWQTRAVAPDASLTVALDVQDPQVPDNAGAWRLRLEGGQVAVERGGGPADLSLQLRIDSLSRLFIGALPPSAAVAADLASADRPERLPLLDRALALPQPWTWDRF